MGYRVIFSASEAGFHSRWCLFKAWRQVGLYRFLAGAIWIASPFLTAVTHASVVFDQCAIPENIYVLKVSNEDELTRAQQKRRELNEIFEWSGRRPETATGHDYWRQIERYYSEYNNALRNTRFVVIVDPLDQNIQLAINTDRKLFRDGSSWVTEYLSFIDAKHNPKARFVCKGNSLGLHWNGRDPDLHKEMFAASQGVLEATLEAGTYVGMHGPSRLRVTRLANGYPPGHGLTDIFYRLSQYHYHWGSRIPLSCVDYQADQQELSPMTLWMTGKRHLGFRPLSDSRLFSDVDRLGALVDETADENVIYPNQTVGIATLRAMLLRARIKLTRAAAVVGISPYRVDSVYTLMHRTAEQMAQAGDTMLTMLQSLLLNQSSIDREALRQLGLTIDQIMGMSGQLAQSMQSNSAIDQATEHLEAERIKAKRTVEEVNRALATIAAQIVRALEREEVLREFVRQSHNERNMATDGTDNVHPPGGNVLTGQNTGESMGADDLAPLLSNEQVEEISSACSLLLSHGATGRAVRFTPELGDNRYGYNTGVELRVVGQKIQVRIQSDRSPWALSTFNQPGEDYVVPHGDVWCRGPLVGVDHASGPIRVTVRGIFDEANNRIFMVSQWSTWDSSSLWRRVLGHGYAWASSAAIVGALALPLFAFQSMVVPTMGPPASLVQVLALYTAASFMLSPVVPPEMRAAHNKIISHYMSRYLLLGQAFYNGYGLESFTSHATLTPNTELK